MATRKYNAYEPPEVTGDLFYRPEREKRKPHDHSIWGKPTCFSAGVPLYIGCPVCERRNHEETRWKITLSDYFMARQPRVNIDACRLMGAPVDMPRKNARDLCRLSDATAIKRAAKFLTLADEYAARRTFDRMRYGKLPSNVYPSWARGYSSPAHVASSWPSYRQRQLDAIYAEEGVAGLLAVGAVEEITIHAPNFAEAA